MSWTYDVSQFQNGSTQGNLYGVTIGALMQTRLLLQDTQPARPLLQDEEIAITFTQHANQYMAAAFLCDMLVARAGAVRMKRISEFQLEYDPKFYQSLASALRARGMTYQVPYCGGLLWSDKLVQQNDPDFVQPRLFIGFADNPRASNPEPGDVSQNTGGGNWNAL